MFHQVYLKYELFLCFVYIIKICFLKFNLKTILKENIKNKYKNTQFKNILTKKIFKQKTKAFSQSQKAE